MATRQQAMLIGVTGWVRNLYDGRVEVFACGNKQQLDDLQHWLAKGPELARVQNVECNTADYEELDDFVIR